MDNLRMIYGIASFGSLVIVSQLVALALVSSRA